MTNENSKPLDPNGNILIPARMIPCFLTSVAIERGVERNILLRTWGGLGDQICAEPTLRYCLSTFRDCDISLASEVPELFGHLPFKRVFNLREERPVYEKYLLLDTIQPCNDSNLLWQFMSHMLVNCVDFASLCAIRSQLPVKSRELVLCPGMAPENPLFEYRHDQEKRVVFVHAGKHWPSKTFPKDWWDDVLSVLRSSGVTPVLIGANTDDNRSTVDVETEGCVDLRNKTSVMETVWLLQHARVLLTNDSAPLHMAASGHAWIGFVATCKHPDMITHWRKGEWGWRMRNFGRGGAWDTIDNCPNKGSTVTIENVEESTLRSWLPDPKVYARWAAEQLDLDLSGDPSGRKV